MKKPILFFIASLLCLSSVFASEKAEDQTTDFTSITLVQKKGDDVKEITLMYENFEEFQTFEAIELEKLFDFTEEDCEVTATVTVRHTYTLGGDVGIASSSNEITVEITAEVTASCSGIASAIRNLTKELKEILGV